MSSLSACLATSVREEIVSESFHYFYERMRVAKETLVEIGWVKGRGKRGTGGTCRGGWGAGGLETACSLVPFLVEIDLSSLSPLPLSSPAVRELSTDRTAQYLNSLSLEFLHTRIQPSPSCRFFFLFFLFLFFLFFLFSRDGGRGTQNTNPRSRSEFRGFQDSLLLSR